MVITLRFIWILYGVQGSVKFESRSIGALGISLSNREQHSFIVWSQDAVRVLPVTVRNT